MLYKPLLDTFYDFFYRCSNSFIINHLLSISGSGSLFSQQTQGPNTW